MELKVAFNLDLVIQGNERKRICDNVYLAIPSQNLHSPHWLKIRSAGPWPGPAGSIPGAVQPLCHPVVKLPAKSSGKRAAYQRIPGTLRGLQYRRQRPPPPGHCLPGTGPENCPFYRRRPAAAQRHCSRHWNRSRPENSAKKFLWLVSAGGKRGILPQLPRTSGFAGLCRYFEPAGLSTDSGQA